MQENEKMLGYLRAINSQIFTYQLFARDFDNAIHLLKHFAMDSTSGFVTTFIQLSRSLN